MDHGQIFPSLWIAQTSALQSVVVGQQHHPGTGRKCKPSGPSSDQLTQDSGVGLAICALTSPPGDSDALHTLTRINNDATCGEHFVSIISLKCSTNIVR